MQRKDFLFRCAGMCAVPFLTYSRLSYRNRNNQNPEPLAPHLMNLIPALMKSANVPGSSVAIVRDGKISWCKGFGVRDRTSGELVNSDTIFEIASVSKTVFAYAVMKLCERGILSLDVPLIKYSAKPILEGDAQLDLITARHVLSHTSGFQNWRTTEEPLKIQFTPGTNFMYSGEGYYYLQSVVTQLTGKVNSNQCGSYEAGLKVCATDIGDYLTRNVLIPNGMHASGYVWTSELGKNEAHAHDTSGKLIAKPHQTATDMARYASAGGLLTSAKEYAQFITRLFKPKEKDPFLLNKNSIKQMVTPQVKLPKDLDIDGASSWALGWAIQERPGGNVILHSGGQTGFRSLTMASPEKKTGFVILTNSDNGGYIVNNLELLNVFNRLFS